MKRNIYSGFVASNYTFLLVKSILLAFIFCISNFHADAKILRLNFVSSNYYTGTAITGVDFTTGPTLMAAHYGDTVQVYPGSATITVTKRLVWIGVGYFTSGNASNANLNVITSTNPSNTFTLQSGSSNSIFLGLPYLNVYIGPNVTIDGVIIKHCLIGPFALQTPAGSTATNWQVSKCFNVGFNNNFINLRIENSQIGDYLSSFSASSTGAIRNCTQVDQQFYCFKF